MKIEVNGHQIEVPDGLSDDQIKTIIQKNSLSFTKAPEQSTGDGFLEGSKNILYGLAKGAADPVYGLAQLGLHGANALYQKAVGPDLSNAIAGKNNNALQRATDGFDGFLKQNESRYQEDTDGSIPAGIGRFVSNAAPSVASLFASGGASAPALVAKATTGLQRVLGGGAVGAATAVPQPVYNADGNYAGRKIDQTEVGGFLGATLPVVGNMAGAAYRTVKPLLSARSTVADNLARGATADMANAGSVPAGQFPSTQGTTSATNPDLLGVSSLAGPRSIDDILSRIKNRTPLVDGSMPTTAQVVATPEMVMAEKTLSNNPAYKAQLLQRENENNSARLAAISRVAKTPEELTTAIGNRETATTPMYNDAWAQTYPVDKTMGGLLTRPSVQAAISRGQGLAKELESQSTIGVDKAIPQVAEQPNNPFRALLGAQPDPTVTVGADTINGQTLQYLKMGLQDMQQEGRANGMGSHESGALKKTFDTLHNWMTDNAPAYKAADAEYARLSQPINDMRVGQAIQEHLSPKALNSAGDVGLTLNNVIGATKKAMGDEGNYGITPGAESLINGVQSDLQRQTISNSVRSAGSDSVYNMQAPNWLAGKLYGNNLDGKGWGLSAITTPLAMGLDMMGGGGLAHSAAMAGMAGAGAKKLNGFIGNRIDGQFQKAMLDPDYFAQLMKEGLARKAQEGGGILSPQASSLSALTGLLGSN